MAYYTIIPVVMAIERQYSILERKPVIDFQIGLWVTTLSIKSLYLRVDPDDEKDLQYSEAGARRRVQQLEAQFPGRRYTFRPRELS